jgi:hypothetical protein
MNAPQHIVNLVVITSAVGSLMALAGLAKQALGRRQRTCPACGRQVAGRCYACGRG